MADITLSRFADVHDALCNPDLRQSLYDAGEVIMKDVLLTLHGEAHKERRHLELRLFRRNYAHFYESEIFPRTLSATLDPLIQDGQLDLVDFGYRVTMNLTADFAGIDRPMDDPAATDRLLAIVRTFSEGATLVHSERDHDIVIAEVKQAQADLQAFLVPSWQRRRRLLKAFEAGDMPEDELPRDVLTVLLRHGQHLADDVIEREICFYLQAGSHSTANSMVHAVHEIFSAAADLEKLTEDPLMLQRYVHESMRLHPASPVAWRSAVLDTQLPDGRILKEGQRLILDLASANRDPGVFGEDADSFNPARRISRAKTGPYGLTFGTGVHMCAGRDLDGGLVADSNTAAATHQYGVVSLLIHALLLRGMTPNPADRPRKDTRTRRENWAYYPVMLRLP